MKKELKKLIKYYGSQKETATVLGITERHVRGILQTNTCGKPLQLLIDKILKENKIKDLIK